MKQPFCSTIILLFCSIAASFAQYPVSATNPSGVSLYPGGRGVDQLVVYTDAYGKSNTGTNEFGAEAVANFHGLVTAVGGNNSPVRKDEVVISGHGKAKDWILENVRLGAKLAVDGRNVAVTYDAESIAYLSTVRLKELREKLARMKSSLTPGEKKNAAELFARTAQLAAEANAACVPLFDQLDYAISFSPAQEKRGLWHRPVERTAAAVESTVTRFANAGFNMLFVETVWRGETIYPGTITGQKERFKNFDPLQAFIAAGKKHGVEIHAWVHTFFVGYLGSLDDRSVGPILARHPDWALVKRNGETMSSAEEGYLYVCPARPAVQDCIASLYKEIRTLYPGIGGLHFDYIRYPVNSSLEESSCYCDFCRHEFQRLAGVDPKTIMPESDPTMWKRWLRWKEDRITQFVRRVRQENPGTVLSAAVFPDINEARGKKMQNWGEWTREKLVDFLAPMIYSPEPASVGPAVENMRSVVGRRYPLFAGLAPFLKLTPSMMLREIEAARDAHVAG
ncbi:MAG: family 10 glycosylhydrolase, partial [Ignavibacteriales bacterium]|nr:family 10 glycosylhydrolase [Ignavibacteriales bacterium]